MTNIKLEGAGADVVGMIVAKRLRELGLTVKFWTNVKPSDTGKLRREATGKEADVCVLAMSK